MGFTIFQHSFFPFIEKTLNIYQTHLKGKGKTTRISQAAYRQNLCQKSLLADSYVIVILRVIPYSGKMH